MKAIILLAEGFELVEATIPYDVLKRSGMEVSFVSITGDVKVLSALGNIIEADDLIENTSFEDIDVLITPGGMPGSENLKNDERVIELIKNRDEKRQWIASICASPIVLDKAGVLKDKRYTCYPGFEEQIQDGMYTGEEVQVDGNIITGKGPGVAFSFAFKIVEMLWGKQSSDSIKESMLITAV